jgi:hypothetical protein
MKFPCFEIQPIRDRFNYNENGDAISKVYMRFVSAHINKFEVKESMAVQSAPNHNRVCHFILSVYGGKL